MYLSFSALAECVKNQLNFSKGPWTSVNSLNFPKVSYASKVSCGCRMFVKHYVNFRNFSEGHKTFCKSLNFWTFSKISLFYFQSSLKFSTVIWITLDLYEFFYTFCKLHKLLWRFLTFSGVSWTSWKFDEFLGHSINVLEISSTSQPLNILKSSSTF